MTDHSDIKEKFNEGMAEFVSNNFGRAVEILNEVLALNPTHKVALAARGSAYLKLDDLSAAVTDFTKVIDIDTGYARAYHLRGLALEKQGHDEKALADFDRAIDADPEYGAAYYSRATLHTKMGHTDEATSDIEMVTHLTNRNIETFANESNIWRSQHLRVESMLENEMNR